MIIAPMFRARLPIVTDKVTCVSTPGKDIDVLVTQGGIAVNPKNNELKLRLKDAGLPLIDIEELKTKTESFIIFTSMHLKILICSVLKAL